MPVNRISATLAEAGRQAVFAAVQTTCQKLPSLIDLTMEETNHFSTALAARDA